jgi:lipopolysaccharide biosynthesis protein
LKQLVDDDVEFDLFVTMPEGNKAFGREIRKTFKAAYIFIAPNQGRDVLPFLRVAKCLESLGYEYFLKLHSKRSPHRGGDGIEWFNEIVSNLLPESKRVRKDILDKLAAADTASICPAGQYISLVVNYEANSNKLKKILERSTTPELAANALAKYGDYGFAAGTMFWGRFDAIKSILDSAFTGYDFDVEKGQIDGTLAHAMERALSVVPEIEQKSLYEVGGHGVQPLKYKTDNVPDWAAEQLD